VANRLAEPALHLVADHRASDLPAHRQPEPAVGRAVLRHDHHEAWSTDPSARGLRPTVVARLPDPRGARERCRGTVTAATGNPRQDALRCSWKGSSGRAACGPSPGAGEGRHVRPPSTCARETRDCASASYGWVDTCASREPPDRAGPGPRRLVRPTPRVKPPNRRSKGGPKAPRWRARDEFEIGLFTSKKGRFVRISERNHCHLGNRRSVESTGRLLLPFERSPRPGQAPPNSPVDPVPLSRGPHAGLPLLPWSSCARPPDGSTVDAGTG